MRLESILRGNNKKFLSHTILQSILLPTFFPLPIIYIYIDIVRLKPVRLVEQIELVLASYVGVILIGGFLREWHTERQDNIYFSFDLKHLRPKQSHNLDAQDN